MMGLDDITKKAQEFLGDNKVTEALHSEQAEDISDKLLDGTADAVNKVTGNKFEDQIEQARAAADTHLGTD
ncbi:antitoxin [Cryobacterium algoricola]|uniref:Antitoxin n=2 Tax=Cryobacterium algoricola TaxID=1259183 RepID=A0ABY2IGJ1_9MICO|nr:antitoxin [Cryobacterium algoricola]